MASFRAPPSFPLDMRQRTSSEATAAENETANQRIRILTYSGLLSGL